MIQNANLNNSPVLNKVDFNDFLGLPKKQRDYIEIKANEDLTDSEIAERIGVHRNTIIKWKHKDTFKSGQQGYQLHYLYSNVPKAMKTMVDLLEAKSELVRHYASKDILDRTGYNFVEKQQVEHIGQVSFIDDIE